MKQLSIFLFIVISACHAPAPTTSSSTEDSSRKKETSDIKEIEFKTGSRGLNKRITFTKDSVILIVNSSFEDIPSKNSRTAIAATEWTKLVNSLQGVDIHQLNKLTSPTMKRAVDAADHSSLAVISDKESIHSFDNYDPHEQLKKLLSIIQEIEKSRNN